MNRTAEKTKNLSLSAMLVSIMLILGYIESLIPISVGIPGIKLGLANSVLLFSIYYLGIKKSFILMLAKVFLSGFLFGNPNIMLYSLSGGVLSLAAMCLLVYVFKGFSPVAVGMLGAVMHNVGQVLMAMLQLQTLDLVYYMAVLVLVGALMGSLTGLICVALFKNIRSIRPKNVQ